MPSKFLTFILFIATMYPLQAEVVDMDFRFMHITSSEGLSQHHVTCMVQDDKGMMWIGTRNGLCLFDGYEMKRYFNNHNTYTLPHNFIRSLFQDAQKRIWIGTDKGACVYLPDMDAFQRFDMPEATINAFAQNANGQLLCASDHLYFLQEENNTFKMIEAISDSIQVLAMAQDASSQLWLATNQGVKVYDKDFRHELAFTNFNADLATKEDGDLINAIFIDDQQNVWIGKNGNGILRINIANHEMQSWTKNTGLTDGMIRTISQDHNGNMWFGSEKGLLILDKSENWHSIQQDFSNPDGLNDNAVYSILRDRDDNMWVGTYFGGINVLKNDYNQFKYYKPGYSSSQLKGKAIRKIVEQENGVFWIATEDGGLNKLNEHTGEIVKIENPALVDNVHALLLDSAANDLWIGMFRGGVTRYNLKKRTFTNYKESHQIGLESDLVFSIAMDKDDVLWFATVRGLRYYDRLSNRFKTIHHQLLSDVFIYVLYVDSENNLWIGTRNYGLYRYNKNTGEVKRWVVNADGNPNGLSDNFISAIFEDSNHQILIGTNNGGLHAIHSADDSIHKVNYLSLQDENCIYGILEDSLNRLWISTNNGLLCVNQDKTNLKRYTTDEGLPVNQFNFSSCLRAKNGKFYFGTVNGLISFNPEEVQIGNRHLDVVLTNLTIGNKIATATSKNSPLKTKFDEAQKITLTSEQARSFGIEYAAISLGHVSNIAYAVRMIGIDKNWHYLNKQRKIIYSGLSHGTYRFQVKATSSNQNWDEALVKELSIEILPPFYLSTWAYVIYLIFIFSILFFVYRFISIRIREKNQIRLGNLEKENIRAMNKLKIDFFTNISHELKTPLTLIISPLQTVLETPDLPQTIQSRLQTVLRNAHRMVKLIEELITFNKIESGETQLHLQKGNPMEFIEEIFGLFRDIALKKGLHYELYLENNEEEVWYSLSSVEKILNNLLSNAIKFTAEGGTVSLYASIVENEQEEIWLNIEVEDTGIGIAKEEVNNIFENYYQTDRGQNFNATGWGIGLALTKNLVKLHKGTISLESEVGKGTKFSIMLNVSEGAFKHNEKSKVRADQDFLVKYDYQKAEIHENSNFQNDSAANVHADAEKKHTLLVVDDNHELAEFLYEIFSPNYRVVKAYDGNEAIKLAMKAYPDLIISDIMMPVMDGIELTKHLKNDLLTSHIPIILLTAKQGDQNTIVGFESGADMYIEKPFNAHALGLMVQNTLRTIEVNRKKLKDDPELSVSAVNISPRDEKLLSSIKSLIEENIQNESLAVSDFTNTLGISRTVLHVKMKSLVDMSITEYIRSIRLNRAKEYLQKGYNVSETAYQTGFSDPNYFSKCFKKKFDTTPSEFIAESAGKGIVD